MTTKLTGSALTMIRGERCLFQDLDFALNPGEILQLEGINGSGKTSLLRAIAGLLSLESGDIFWNGRSVREQRQEFHTQMVWYAHRTGLKGDLSFVENLQFESQLRASSAVDHDAVFERLGIAGLKSLPIRSLSAGQQRRAALARLLLADVPLWLMDEPFTNLDREGRELIIAITEQHLAAGGLCVMAAHQDFAIDADVKRVSL